MLERREQAKVVRFYRKGADANLKERPRPDLPPGTDTLPIVEHIVVLMMENHSYDNYLGMLAGRGEGARIAADGQPAATNSDVRAYHLEGTRQLPGVPTQSWAATHLQWNNGANDGFVHSIEATAPGHPANITMGYWGEADLPFYYGLARTFPLADHWHSSCLGPTFPNRRFLIAGTANGLIDDLPFMMFDYPKSGTIFDLLTRNGISWVNYHHVHPARILLKRLLGHLGLQAGRRALDSVAGIVPALVKNAQGNKQFTADLYPLGLTGCLRHLRPIDRFFRDAAAGTLPALSIVDPDFDACSEENAQDVQVGEGFAARVIQAVMDGKAWDKTLLIWTYDEHGGYYDHVPPPAAVAPDDVKGRSVVDRGNVLGWILRHSSVGRKITTVDDGTRTYDRYGFRVPAVIISPYAKPDYVATATYDHTSILKLIERKWNLPALTERDAAALDPLDAVDFDAPPHFLVPPTLPAPGRPWGG